MTEEWQDPEVFEYRVRICYSAVVYGPDEDQLHPWTTKEDALGFISIYHNAWDGPDLFKLERRRVTYGEVEDVPITPHIDDAGGTVFTDRRAEPRDEDDRRSPFRRLLDGLGLRRVGYHKPRHPHYERTDR